MRLSTFAAVVATLLLAPPPLAAAGAAAAPPKAAAPAGGVAYEGDDRATVRLAPALAAVVEEYANAGYAVRRGPGAGEVTVEVSLAPLASRAPFVAPGGDAEGDEAAAGTGEAAGAALAGDDLALAALAAVAGAKTVHQAVTGILGWMVHHVEGGDEAAGGADGPDAAAVARQAVAMLGAVGIEARTVDGRVVGPPRPGAPRGRHVWIEVRYPDRGWAFSDPLHHHHYVPASYLRLGGAAAGGAGTAAPGASDATLVERQDRRLPVDVYRAGGPGVGARRNDVVQVAAALRVVVPDAAEGAAVLVAADGTTQRKALLDGEGVFVGLAGGAYTLEVLVPGRTGLTRHLDLAPRERSAVYFGGEEAARGAAAGERPPPPPSAEQPKRSEPDHARRRAPR